MSPIPFTLDDAREICEDFEDLIDTEFRYAGTDILVENVVVTPYAEPAKTDFLVALANANNAMELLSEYEADGYDVVIVGLVDDNGEPKHYIPVTQYVAENGINYNLPSGSH
jgi:hypothetical protein